MMGGMQPHLYQQNKQWMDVEGFVDMKYNNQRSWSFKLLISDNKVAPLHSSKLSHVETTAVTLIQLDIFLNIIFDDFTTMV